MPVLCSRGRSFEFVIAHARELELESALASVRTFRQRIRSGAGTILECLGKVRLGLEE
jgi:hypothetical protein